MRFIFALVFCFMVAVTNVYSDDATINPLDRVFDLYPMRLEVPITSMITSVDGPTLQALLQAWLDGHGIKPSGARAQPNPVPPVPAPENPASSAPVPPGPVPPSPAPENPTSAPDVPAPSPTSAPVPPNPAPENPSSAPDVPAPSPTSAPVPPNPAPENPTSAPVPPATTTAAPQAPAEPSTTNAPQAPAEPSTTTAPGVPPSTSPTANTETTAAQTTPTGTASPTSTTERLLPPDEGLRRKRRQIDIENGDESKYAFDPEFAKTLQKAKEDAAKVLAQYGDDNLKAYYVRGTLTATPLV